MRLHFTNLVVLLPRTRPQRVWEHAEGAILRAKMQEMAPKPQRKGPAPLEEAHERIGAWCEAPAPSLLPPSQEWPGKRWRWSPSPLSSKKETYGVVCFQPAKVSFQCTFSSCSKITCMSANLRDFSCFVMSGDAGGWWQSYLRAPS